MRIIAYLYTDSLLEPQPDHDLWGWEIDRVYQDLSVRKPSPHRELRPQFQQLLTDAQVEAADYLLIRRLEELGTSLQQVSDRLSELTVLGIQVITTEQNYPLATPASDPSLGAIAIDSSAAIAATDQRVSLLKLLQEVQRQQRSRQIRQGHARNRLKAIPPPGRAPYGYRRGKERYALDRNAATVVKDFFEHFLLYGSLRGAVRYLDQQHGKKISVSTAHRWLTNPVYRGDLAYHNGQTLSNTHVPILSREEAAQVDRLLRRNRRLPPRTASAPRSLAGLVICAACQSPMTITRVTAPRRVQEYLYLRPTRCPQQPRCGSLVYDQVLEQTIQVICRDLPLAVAGGPLPDMEGIKQGLVGAIAQKEGVLDQIPDLVHTGVLDSETAELRVYKLRTEISQLQAQMAQLPPVNLQALAQTVSIPRFWLDLSEAERRFYFREFIRQIEILREPQQVLVRLSFIFG
ncbi:recombinase [Neosynechococcus sphagnicola sy1]|uniref:Recombinase n=1 Tax=Neosynechococcus sphagnicola sy1 TaxID=1497020 RepID=A0A098TQ06_9CYAN|nr:recombinase family protein [Neosynechococcus sphagnicola]KGF73957.1 recombinase [Neosynechococcus sphagnicola sy1]